MKLGYIYAGKVIGNLAPGGTDPYTNEPSAHELGCDLGKDGAITDPICPLIVKTDKYTNWLPDDHASTIANDCFGLWVLMEIGNTPGATSAILRLESSTKGITLDSAINVPCGGVPAGDISYLMALSPAHKSAWDETGSPSDADGFLKFRVGDADRWVQLYKTAPGA